ncbi:sulfite exporter TauE/SafE family protein [Acidimangrovimonas sediminis]|uniref:sulfite exporter TauE/SafE family protein n=1 Tax=Acidimangrovimonas sediminis TaxID=2056283 RepID=UPI000C80330C|nr:sulfite exporter TauE/SafE family protein [Acidimangrovimonas sediminis]
MTGALLPLLAILIASGAVAGLISGLLGVGGGIVLVPAFYYAFSALGYHPDQLMQICVATSTGTIIFTSLRSVTSHMKRGSVSVDLLKSWGPFVALGSVLGVLAATRLESSELELAFGLLGLCIGLYMLLGNSNWRISETLPGRGLSIVYSMFIGFFSALMGVGGGSFTVPLLTAYGFPPVKAVGTSPGFGLALSVPGFLVFLMAGWHVSGKPPLTVGYVNIPAVVLIVLTTMLTVPLGVRLAHSLKPQTLRMIFACLVLVVAVNTLREAIF